MNNIFLMTLLVGSLIGVGIFGLAAIGDGDMINGMDWSSDHHGMMSGDNHHMGDSKHYEECEEYMDEHCEYENYEDCEEYSDECEEHDEEYCEHHEDHDEEQQNDYITIYAIIDHNIQERTITSAIDQ